MAKKSPKIVVLGAGSAIFGLGALSTMMQSARLRGAEIGLCDIDAQGLKTVTALAHKMNEAWDSNITITSSTERRDLLPGADFVIVSVQVGPREEVWEQDWRIPLRHGVHQPYAENGGPGAFAHAARGIPLLLDIAHDMEDLCPDAYYLNLVNPLIRTTLAIHRYSRVKVVGLCHQLLWGYALVGAILADRFDIPLPNHFHLHTNADNMPNFIPVARQAVQRLSIRAAGINHFSWMLDIRDKETGEDLYPEVRDRWLHHYRRDFEPLSREVFEIFGLVPTAGDAHLCEFLPFVSDPVAKPWEKFHLTLQSWDGNRKRRADRKALAEAIVRGDRDVDDLRDVWRHNMLDEGIPEMIDGVMSNNNHYHQQLNLPNQGYIPGLPENAIVEVPGTISAYGFQGQSFPALPPGITAMCHRELENASLVVDAAVTGDRQLALQALLLDPMVGDLDTARAILNDFIKDFAQYLPQFA